MYQGDNDESNKKESKPSSDDFNATHKMEEVKNKIYCLSQAVATTMQPVTSFSREIDRKIFCRSF